MKIRSGFVSNSSSSSYICDVTGEAFEVRDGCFWDAGLAQCKKGHIFKKEFLTPWTPEYPTRKEMWAKLDGITDSKRECMRFREMSEEELKQAYAKAFMGMGEQENGYQSNVNQCPICTLKRLGDTMLLDFVLKKSKSSREEVLQQIQKECKNFGQLQKYLTNK